MAEFIHSDNLEALEVLAAQGRLFTLAYLDPPFATGKTYRAGDRLAFRDPKDLIEWRSSLFDVVYEIRGLLEPWGSVVIHVDPKVSHQARRVLDTVFGSECYASEIIWRYRRWPSKTRNFQRVHDVLLRYVRDPKAKTRFNQLYEPPAASTLTAWGTGKQRAVVDETGRRRRSSTTDEPSPGVPMGDVWDIGIVAPVSAERTGYPTQKPEALLERLILSLTDPGDAVLDPYCGSGTTLAVAKRLGRPSVGIDSSALAYEVARTRLEVRE